MPKTVEAVYNHGQINLLERVTFKRKTFRLTVNLPDEVLQDTDPAGPEPEPMRQRVSELTREYLAGRVVRDRSFKELKLDSQGIAQAVVRAFGTSDPVKLVEKLRR